MSKCLWKSWKISCWPAWLWLNIDIEIVTSKVNSKVGKNMKKWEFLLNENAFSEFWIGPRSTKWSLENASQRWNMWKTQGFEHFSFNMAEKSWRQLQGGESADSPVSICFYHLVILHQPIETNDGQYSMSSTDPHLCCGVQHIQIQLESLAERGSTF